MKQPAYIFDIDGTLADCTHRLHYIRNGIETEDGNIFRAHGWEPDWDSFYAACVRDKPIEEVIRVCRAISDFGKTLIFVTGRPTTIAEQTTDWLNKNVVHRGLLYMRKAGDHRADYEVKREIYEREIKDKYKILGVFEDRQQCVDMWRSLGLTCFQVAKGNY